MSAVSNILDEARSLTDAEKFNVIEHLVEDVMSRSNARFTSSERRAIEGVLSDRVDGPFEPFPSNWKDEVRQRAAELKGR